MKRLPIELTEAACYYCDPERCKKIFQTGFDVNTQDETGATILMHAVAPDEHGDINAPEYILKLVEFLLEYGADPKLVDNNGMKAADFAKRFLDPNREDVFGNKLTLNSKDIGTMKYIVELLNNW